MLDLRTAPARRFAAVVEASNLWGLRRARAALHTTTAGLDRTLPAIAERRVLTVPGAAGPLECRLYSPLGAAADAPLMLFFHGGGFVVSDLDSHEALCIRLADAGKVRVLAASYRLAPESRFPAQLEDALAVVRWLLEQGAGVLGPWTALGIGGDSAGGYLAAAAAARTHASAPGSIRAQLLLYPLLHLDESAWSEGLMRETRVLGWAAVRYINLQLAGTGGGEHAPSLLAASRIAPIQTLIASGGPLDPCRADAVALATKLRAAGRPVVVREYPMMVHGFGSLTHLSEKARLALSELGALMGGMLGEAARS
jgi:acetyl esterase